ncbi:MAG TPA: succinate dehydrogenase assembly factor 2 [Azospirillaceae bacterium]|nr:succinate dehydrogenase assembly factor 2 [Azospirillaceae bacterium]
MTGSTRTSADLDVRRRRILFRSWHRGLREMDLLMGRFADAEIGTMSDDDLLAFERLIEVPDADLYRWITGELATPSKDDSPVLRRLKAFHTHDAALYG